MRLATSNLLLIGLMALPMFIAGCGGSGGSGKTTVSGINGEVTLDGQPLSKGILQLTDDSQGVGTSAEIVEGKYLFSSPVPVGKYVVNVLPPAPPAPHEMDTAPKETVKIPVKYTTVQGGLTADITPENLKHSFELKSR